MGPAFVVTHPIMHDKESKQAFHVCHDSSICPPYYNIYPCLFFLFVNK